MQVIQYIPEEKRLVITNCIRSEKIIVIETNPHTGVVDISSSLRVDTVYMNSKNIMAWTARIEAPMHKVRVSELEREVAQLRSDVRVLNKGLTQAGVVVNDISSDPWSRLNGVRKIIKSSYEAIGGSL